MTTVFRRGDDLMADIRWWDEESGERVYVHDASNLNELHEAESEIRELAGEHGALLRAVIGANAINDDGDRVQFLIDNGYKQVFSVVFMELDDLSHLPNASIPSDFELRTAKSEDLRTLWELNNLAYAGRAFISVGTEAGFEQLRHDLGDFSLVTVAQYGTEIAGFVASEIRRDPDHAYVNEVTVHPDYRRRGLARAMLATNLTWARERGVNRARLDTNGEDVSGARSLYEKFGFKVFETHLRFRKPL